MNEHVMRCYYIATKLDTQVVGYRPEMWRLFVLKYPELTERITEQRVVDQKRTILVTKKVTAVRLEQIKAEVAADLQLGSDPDITGEGEIEMQSPETSRSAVAVADVSQVSPEANPIRHAAETQNFEDTYLRNLRNEFAIAIAEFMGTDPLKRPQIPRQNTSRKMAVALQAVNTIVLPEYLAVADQAFQTIHTAIYAAAVCVVRSIGGKVRVSPKKLDAKTRIPAWELRLTRGVDKLRYYIGHLTQYIKGNRNPKIVSTYHQLCKEETKHTRHDPPNKTPEEILDTLRQKLALKANRLRRYRVAAKRKRDNSTFAQSEKQFYRRLRSGPVSSEEGQERKDGQLPRESDIEDFWRGIWSNSVNHNKHASWIESEVKRVNDTPPMDSVVITADDVAKSVNKTLNWKATGLDGIHNYWLKKLTSVHEPLAKCFSLFLQNPREVPPYLATGVTYLLPKDGNTENPAKYRPITCLCTVYKLLTSCLADKIYTHLQSHSLLAEEQKGCIKRSQGCKEQLIIDAVATEQAYHRTRNIHMAYIDYRKAFDSVPHSWLVKVLELYKINTEMVALLEHLMSLWETELSLGNSIRTRRIPIRRGIFQGDSLSPLWFCLALNPLSSLLKETGYGFQIKGSTQFRLSHLLYMDDIKIYAANARELRALLHCTEQFSNDIKMSFGLEKCKTLSVERGKVIPSEGYNLHSEGEIDAMVEGDTYKYLGLLQSLRADHKDIRTRVTKEYHRRLGAILKSGLNGKNLFKAINTFAIPVLTYTFGVVKWPQTEIEGVERSTRVMLTKHRAHHPKSAVERITLPRTVGGRGMVDIGRLCAKQIEGLQKYFCAQDTSPLHLAVVSADNKFTPLDLLHFKTTTPLDTDAMHVKSKIDQWTSKPLHGRFAYELSQPHVDREASNSWLSRGQIFAETEGFMLAIQDQVVSTRNYLKYIIKAEVEDDKCRRCHQVTETIQHITGACQALASREYTERHNDVAKVVHQALALKYDLLSGAEVPYWQYQPKSVLDNRTHQLYWDRSVLTDRPIPHNRPDIILVERANGTTWLLDIGVPNTHNIKGYFEEKLKKYEQLAEEIRQVWQQREVYVVPLILSSTGVIPKSLLEGLTKLGLPSTLHNKMQKAVVLRTTAIVRRHLNLT